MNWQLQKITGTRETIKANIAKSTAPKAIQDLISSEVDSIPGTPAIIAVTGYSADHKNPLHPSAVTRNIQITISAATL